MENWLDDLKNRIDVVEVVRKHAPDLKKSGQNLVCRSPFRKERTPSFFVSPSKQFWYDFGAGEGGDAISFVEKIENVTFQEALHILADTVGFEIPAKASLSPEKKEEKKTIALIHERALEFFGTSYQKHKEAQKYLKDRKFSPQTIEEWGLGYGGDDQQGLSKFLLGENFPPHEINMSGVSFERNFGDKGMLDRFWGRIMIPIREPRRGDIIAFSGRDILNREKVGKYINSPENPLYNKSATLFGLFEAKQIIKEKDSVILVEGNFDVIALHAKGVKNVVATCGTSLTEDHLRILKRFTNNILLGFDTDLAGKKATLKATEMILRMELSPKIIEYTEAKDLDEWSLHRSTEEIQDLVNQSKVAFDFFFEKFSTKNLNGTLDGEKKFLDAFFYFLNLSERAIEVDEYLLRCATKTSRPKAVIEAEFKRFQSQSINYQKPSPGKETVIQFSREECFVGFIDAYESILGEYLNQEIIDLFSEGKTKELLSKKILGLPLSEEDALKIKSWALFQESQYPLPLEEDKIKEDFDFYIKLFEKLKEEGRRTKAAQELMAKLRKT